MSPINRTFKLEGWIMFAIVAVPIVLGIVAALVLPWIQVQLDTRRCQEAGLSYDDKKQACIHAEDQSKTRSGSL